MAAIQLSLVSENAVLNLRALGENWLNQIWYGTQQSWALDALVPLYRGLRRIDLWLKPKTSVTGRSLGLPPIIVVGNLTVGGSGKTPLVIHLVQQAQAAGFRPGVITRGYGSRAASAKSVLVLNSERSVDWRDCGDEALLIRQRCQCAVAVGSDRLAAARAIAGQCDLLICDDGLQNPAIPRELEVLVIDGMRRFGNQRLLPAGPLREPLPPRLDERFPWRVNNGGIHPELGEISMRLICEFAYNTVSGASRPLGEFEHVHALAGIGNPKRFYDMLEGFGMECRPVPVGDHQALAERDLDALNADGLPVLMTEKDAIKYQPAPTHWVVPVEAHLSRPLWPALQAELAADKFSGLRS